MLAVSKEALWLKSAAVLTERSVDALQVLVLPSPMMLYVHHSRMLIPETVAPSSRTS